jgi:hypothetical protein
MFVSDFAGFLLKAAAGAVSEILRGAGHVRLLRGAAEGKRCQSCSAIDVGTS